VRYPQAVRENHGKMEARKLNKGTEKVRVKSPARLHLGIIDLSGSLGRKYGSIGVAIEEPSVELFAEKSSESAVELAKGVRASADEIRRYAALVLQRYGVGGNVRIEVKRDIPRNVGLGSTTQLALSVAVAVSKLYGIKATIRDLSILLGRGIVSGIGTAAFERGGFIVDGGTKTGERLPPVILRMDFPEEWFFVVVVPLAARGFGEDEERRIFEGISGSPEVAGKISRLLVMGMLPALVERDLAGFGRALTEIQRLVGESFSRYQAGIFHSKESEELVRFMLENGASGAGQSSWGPTVYGLVGGAGGCKELKSKLEKFLEERRILARVYCCRAANHGAFIGSA
jgi:beta-ribofuranosylaminobenzene 5'-phosphate synthase